MPEHGNADRTKNSGRGIHPILGFTDVADATARTAIIQTAVDKGRVVHQTGGDVPGYYMADGAGAWYRLDIGHPPALSPAILGGNANDYQPVNAQAWRYGEIFRITSSLAVRITGFAVVGGAPSGIRHIINANAAGSFTITLGYEDVASLVGNRILIAGASDLVLSPMASATIVYDATSAKWRVI